MDRGYTAKKLGKCCTICCYAMNIQTARQIKNSPYALVFGLSPLRHFTLLNEIKQLNINSKDEPEDWFEQPRSLIIMITIKKLSNL
ncbi:hypothetical protein F8M41_010502 [Gigaspora margarita]|uniref:Uncharacterized protein n=1 Tax=Gigaspora margarita TaxID=4874 RepID=A0A8H3X2K4_GIGMA|nr:hypothetical protein F8M41_010502 [Gigaspora margarita]